MPYKINGKFVSREKYEAHCASEKKETPVSDTEHATERQISPLVLATRELTKAKARLDKAEKAAQKVVDVQDELEDARVAYDRAKEQVSELM
jgi:hypothetical protein